uniref:Galactosylgalactosylxylosylprotein 3-beta-glucuronosyltransferase n=1 Tax=Papio anubis TaxID=9555 RepID=A0A8I5R0Y2_PAPAN
MKSVLFTRFFILLPWILIVIIMLDVDTRKPAPPLTPRPYFSPYAVGRGGARLPLRRGGPAHGTQKRNQSRPQPQPEPQLPTIYAITPTYSRPVQKAELTRLANTFRQVAQLHWILVEDAAARSELVSRFLARAGLPSTHLHVPTPRRYKRPGLPRATEQRNAGLAWLRQRHQHQRAQPGVLFFADDDNTYSLELFQEPKKIFLIDLTPCETVAFLHLKFLDVLLRRDSPCPPPQFLFSQVNWTLGKYYVCEPLVRSPSGLWAWLVGGATNVRWWKMAKLLAGTPAGEQTGLLPSTWQDLL